MKSSEKFQEFVRSSSHGSIPTPPRTEGPEFINQSPVPVVGLLASLEIYGCGEIEDAILAGLALGEPVLLIGAPGGAKSALAERLAATLGLTFWAYDASKAMFEDIVGFPSPASLGEGEVRYIPTPLSLQGKQFVLIDEVSRANPSMQNKWLEVIHARRVMGMALTDLQFVFGAMNPPGLAGTVPLDDALAGRFVFHVVLPGVQEMSIPDQRRVIQTQPQGSWQLHKASAGLGHLIFAVRGRLPGVELAYGEMITTYLHGFATELDNWDWKIDGRRLAMMRRGILALIAVREQQGKQTVPPGSLEPVIRHGLDVLLPWIATGKDLPAVRLERAHKAAIEVTLGHGFVHPPGDTLKTARQIIDGLWRDDKDVLSQLVTKILHIMDRPIKPEVAIRAAAAMVVLVSCKNVLGLLPLEARQRLMVNWSESLEISADDAEDYFEKAADVQLPMALAVDLRDPVLRLTTTLKSRLSKQGHSRMDFAEMAVNLAELVCNGGAA